MRGTKACGCLEAPEPVQGQLSTCPSGYLPRSRELRSGSEWHPWQVLVVIAHTSRCSSSRHALLGHQHAMKSSLVLQPMSARVALFSRQLPMPLRGATGDENEATTM